jgi:hypothetical protein
MHISHWHLFIEGIIEVVADRIEPLTPDFSGPSCQWS